jgi:hypothetical protein
VRDGETFDLERSRSLGEILKGAAVLYRRFPWLFAVLAFGVILPWQLAVLAVTGYGPLHRGHEALLTSFLVEALRNNLIGPLISALHIYAVVEIGKGRRPRLATVARHGLLVLPVVAAAEIVANIGIALGSMLVIPGIILALRWSVVAQAAAAERIGWSDALSRSGELARGHYGHVFVVFLTGGLLAFALVLAVRLAPLGDSSGAGSVAAGIALNTFTASFAALTIALLYFDLRARPGNAPAAPREHPHLRDLD